MPIDDEDLLAVQSDLLDPPRLARQDELVAATFRLVVNKTELPGLWVCIGRRFVPLAEAAEEL
jgi:hypothetical protein